VLVFAALATVMYVTRNVDWRRAARPAEVQHDRSGEVG
jgi:inner membrane protein involved in colicin E2 resistance